MILVYGIPTEGPLALVIEQLRRRGAAVAVLHQRQIDPSHSEFHLTAGGVVGVVQTSDGRIDLGSVRAVYARPASVMTLPEYMRESPEVRVRRRYVDEMLRAFLDNTAAMVVNRPRDMLSNLSKPLQARRILEWDFWIPRTLVTNDLTAMREFAGGVSVIYKSVSGERSLVQAIDPGAQRDRIGLVPVQFQEFVEGTDLRVHVIEDRVVACAIKHDRVDYRDARQGSMPRVVAVEIPSVLEAKCVGLCRSLGLHFGGVDLRVTASGRIYCFEVNPSPGFDFYERASGNGIASILADALCKQTA